MRELTVHQESSLLRPELRELAAEAIRSHQRARKCAAAAMRNIVRAGHALRKLRDLCDDAEWREIVARFDGSERTVQRYMLLAKYWPLLESAAPPNSLTSQRKAMRLLQTLLYGEPAPARVSGRRAGARGANPAGVIFDANDDLPRLPAARPPALESPAPAAPDGKSPDDGLERLYRELHRLLEGLLDDFVWRMSSDPMMKRARSLISDLFHRINQIERLRFVPTADQD